MANGKIWLSAAIATSMWCGSVIDSIAGECRLESPAHRATVIELYTSEGCNSCPPVDRWFGGLAQQGISPETAVLLAFHVDYWNQLGWPDRFSRSQFSDRQRDVAARHGSGVIYTPQLTVDGRDFRQRYDLESLRRKLTENGLSSRVTAGENAGSRLNHDYVVRELAGPFSIGAGSRTALEHRIKLQSDWNAERVGIAIFVERSDTGEILEATAKYPLCLS